MSAKFSAGQRVRIEVEGDVLDVDVPGAVLRVRVPGWGDVFLPACHATVVRPPEPLGLGAVVQDGNGTLWVRAMGADWYGSGGRYRVWELIQGPVTVLSPGWSE